MVKKSFSLHTAYGLANGVPLNKKNSFCRFHSYEEDNKYRLCDAVCSRSFSKVWSQPAAAPKFGLVVTFLRCWGRRSRIETFITLSKSKKLISDKSGAITRYTHMCPKDFLWLWYVLLIRVIY